MKINIRLKLIGFTMCIVFMVGGLITFYSIYIGRYQIIKMFEKDCRKITTVIAEIIIDNIYTLDISSLILQLENTNINPDIKFTYVMDSEGVLLTDGINNFTVRNQRLTDVFSKEIMLSDNWISRIEAEVLKIGGPIFMADGRHIGYLHVGFSLTKPYQIVHDMVRSIFYLTVFCLLFAVILAFVLSNNFSKPILIMVQALMKIGKGKLDTQLLVNRKDELGVLAKSINKMTNDLQKTTVSKEYVDKIITNMADTLIVVSPEEIIQKVNQATCDLMGYKEDELIGKPVRMVFLRDKQYINGILTEDLIKKSIIRDVEETYVSKDGRRIPVLFSASTMHDVNGNIQGIICVALDITERKKAEEQIRKLSQAIEYSSATVVISDTEGNIEYANPKFTQVTGYSLDEIIGKNPRILKSGKTPPEVYKGLWEAITSGKEWRGDFCNKKKNGELYWESALISPVKDDGGAITNFIAIKDDITERKLFEEKIAGLTHILEESLNEVYIFDAKTLRFIHVNKGAILNLCYSMEELSSLTPLDLKPEFTAELFAKMVEPLRVGEKKKVQFTTVHQRKDGSLYDVEVHLQLSTFQAVPAFVAIILDITERKKAESERDRFFNKSIDMLCIAGFDGNFKQLNPAWTLTLGWSIDELLRRPWLSFVHPDDQQSTIETEEQLQYGKSVVEFENRYQCRDGTYRWISWNSFPILEEKQIFAVARDITERKQAEKRLKDTFEQTRVWLDNSPVCTKVVDLDFNLKYMSASGIKALKIDDVTKLYGKPYPFDFFPESFEKSMTKSLEKVRETGEVITGESPVCDIDGNELWYQATIVPVKDIEDRIDFIIIVSVDINERKKMEEALLQSEKLKSIGTITAGISHEFNNLLAIISGNVQLLEGSRKDDEELMDALRIIKRATNDGSEICSKMLKFTKIAKDTSGFVPFDINELINQAIDFTLPRWKNMAQAKGINYHMDTEGMKRIPSILCNPTELREVFVNIINNALDAMPDDGRISFSTWSGEDTVFISITDTGEGMSEEVKKNIFDPFFTTKIAVGTGLGMSTAYGIITGHGGNIEVESAVGKGTIFTLQFPSAAKADSPKESLEPKQEIKSNCLRILVVDDEEEICNILDKFFSKEGHLVRTVDNGREAIMLTKIDDYDLVLCDMAMPEVYGYDVIKALNKLEKRPKIGIITGWGDKLKPSEEEGLKVDFIIKKPFDFSELTRNINNILCTE